MSTSKAGMTDNVDIAMEMAVDKSKDEAGLYGYGVIELFDADGNLKESEPFANRITTAGDEYYIKRAAAGIGTPNLAQPTLVGGMKLGTGATAASKSGAGATLGAYITGSNKVLDTSHPTVAAVGGDSGWNVVYKTTWAAGEATNGAITEAALIVDPADNTNSTLAEVVARITFTAKNKTAADTLAITWTHTFLGA